MCLILRIYFAEFYRNASNNRLQKMVALSTLGSLGWSQRNQSCTFSCLKAAFTIALRVFPIAPPERKQNSRIYSEFYYMFLCNCLPYVFEQIYQSHPLTTLGHQGELSSTPCAFYLELWHPTLFLPPLVYDQLDATKSWWLLSVT